MNHPPTSGATSEAHHREASTSAAPAPGANEAETSAGEESTSSNFFANGRKRKTSNDLNGPAAGTDQANAAVEEARPRTTTLSSVNDPEATVVAPVSPGRSAGSQSHFYGPYASSGEASSACPAVDSEPSTPVAPEHAQLGSLKREHRPTPLHLTHKYASTEAVQVASARQPHAGRCGSPRQKDSSGNESGARPYSATTTPQSALRRVRSSSLPPSRDYGVASSKRKKRRDEKASVDLGSAINSSSATAASQQSARAVLSAPLSQFQLLALHQLSLPRPAYISSNSSSRWSNSAHKRKNHQPSLTQGFSHTNLYAPSLLPPISLATLRELDLGEILRNPQLRHDIVFDPNLIFRPNFDGSRGQKKIEASERFWTAVEREIATGCRCTVFNDAGEVLPCVCPGENLANCAVSALCQRKAEASHAAHKRRGLDNLPVAARLPSRVGPLVGELRAILLSLLPSPPAAGPDVGGSYELISTVLDPDLIRQEVEHGVLDVARLARFLGDTLRIHCAPMRDEMVDVMVSRIEGGSTTAGPSISQGLQMAFEILELMKLDIANHQLRTLRPYLLETALEFELRGCLDFAERYKSSAFLRTQSWLQAASARIGSSQAFAVVNDGLLEVAFNYECLEAVKWDRLAAQAAARSVPETLQLDLHRIRLFHSDITDLTVIYMLQMLFRSLAGPNVTDTQLESVCNDIWVLMQSNKLTRASTASDASSMPASSALSRIGKLENQEWRQGMADVLLQVAARAEAVKQGREASHNMAPPSQKGLAMLQGWMDTNMRACSPLFRLLQSRLRENLQRIICSQYGPEAGSASSAWWMRSIQPIEESSLSSLPTPLTSSWGQCSKAARLMDLPAVNGSANRPFKRSRDDTAGQFSSRKRRKVMSQFGIQGIDGGENEESAIESLLRQHGLYCLRRELQALSDRIGKVSAFNVEVWELLYSQLLSA